MRLAMALGDGRSKNLHVVGFFKASRDLIELGAKPFESLDEIKFSTNFMWVESHGGVDRSRASVYMGQW